MNAPLPSTHITNAFTCDVEDYFQVSALAPHFPRDQWDAVPCRIERNVDRVLELLDGHGARGTFFTLGWIAERFPQLVRRIGGELPLGGQQLGHVAHRQRGGGQVRRPLGITTVDPRGQLAGGQCAGQCHAPECAPCGPRMADPDRQ